jgi:hypothetical protein
MKRKLTKEQREFLDQKRKDCGVELHVGIPCLEAECYCTEDAICELCMIAEYEACGCQGLDPYCPCQEKQLQIESESLAGIDPEHEQDILDEQDALQKGNA